MDIPVIEQQCIASRCLCAVSFGEKIVRGQLVMFHHHILDVKFEKGLQRSFRLKLPHMLITWYCAVQSHM